MIDEILKCKKLYVNNNGNNNSFITLKDKLKALNKLYMTNNICESIHGLISKNLPNTRVTKNNFRDTINYIIKNNDFKTKNIIRRDYITRTLVVIIEKYDLNKDYKFIQYDIFKKELENVIALMTGKINIKSVEELINSIEFVENEEDSENKKESISESNISIIKSVKEIEENLHKEDISDSEISFNSSEEINDEFGKLINENFILSKKDIENFPENNDNLLSNELKEEVLNNVLDDERNKQDDRDINEISEDLGDLKLFILDNNFNNDDIKSILLKENNDDIDSLNNRFDKLNIKKKEKKEKRKKYIIQKNKYLN